MSLYQELVWRGFVHNCTPNAEEWLNKSKMRIYIGFDPTSDSLHVGNLMQIMLLKHLQLAGHIPVVLVGGATGMIGDPSGKSQERNLLSFDVIEYNQNAIAQQLQKLLDFSNECLNRAVLLNNYEWFKEYRFIDFLRDIGKYITINYMLAKESVQKRMETGISFTEFAYQLLQAYDFYYLFKQYDCKIQMGGADQWGNITTGIELIRKIADEEAAGLTAPLLTKSDGSKFGKTEEGTIWLAPHKTSPYKFYQFWLNTSDEDLEKLLKLFTLFSPKEINQILKQHKKNPSERIGQKKLAEFVTTFVHSEQDYQNAVKASQILFSDGTREDFEQLDWNTLQELFNGVPRSNVPYNYLENPLNIVQVLSEQGIYPSKTEARKAIQAGAVKINRSKITDVQHSLSNSDWLFETCIVVQKGKKQFHLIIRE